MPILQILSPALETDNGQLWKRWQSRVGLSALSSGFNTFESQKRSGSFGMRGGSRGERRVWEYIDRVFEITPSNNKLDPAELPKIANEIGLDQEKFESCLASGK